MTDELTSTPIPEYDHQYARDPRRPFCKVVTKINRDALFEDLFLHLLRH